MSKHVTRRLAGMCLVLAAASVTMLVATGAALARGPLPLRAVKGDLLTAGPAFPFVLIPIAIAIAIAVFALVARRQSVAARAVDGEPVTLLTPRENAGAQAKHAA
jgi:hypothetical protein